MDSQFEDKLPGLWQKEKWKAYRNALPLGQPLLDITTLDGDFAFRLAEQVLGGLPFQLTAKAPFEQARRLQAIYFESRAFERSRGAHPFGLGFPLYVAIDDNGEAVASPVFIWGLTLEPGAKPGDGWPISRRPFQQADYNHFLAAYWRRVFGQDLTSVLADACSEGAPSAAGLVGLCDQLSEALGLEGGGGQIALSPIPTQQQALMSAGAGRIVWAGVLGVFPPHQHLFAGLKPDTDDELSEPSMPMHSFGLLPLGPDQASAAALARQQGHVLAVGPAGTGKTQLAINLLANALSNGQRCLFVSPRVGALRQAQQKLEQLGLGRLSFLLRDVNLDMPLFLEILRSTATAKEAGGEPGGEDFRILVSRLERLKEKLDASYHASRKTAFGADSWAATAGRYLKSIRREGKEALATQLNAQDYRFDEAGYEEMSQAIASCQRLFDKSGTLRSPLNNLHQGVFLRMEKEEALAFVQEKTAAMLERALRLQQWYVNRINTYSDLLSSHYEQYYQGLARRLSNLQDELSEHQGRFGQAYATAGMGRLRFRSVFSGKYREMLDARQQLATGYARLRADFTLNPYFDFAFGDADSGADMAEVKANLAGFQLALQNWYGGLRDAVQEEAQRLSPKTTLPVLNFSAQVAELESGLEGLLTQLNECGLYHLPVHNKMLTIPRQQRLLDELIEQLEITRRSLAEFDDFYEWQHNWLQLAEQARRLVRALIKLRPQDWQAAFDSWFLDNCLRQQYEAVLPPEEGTLDKLEAAYERMSERVVPRLLQEWQPRREEGLRQLRRSSKEAGQWLASKRPPEAFKEWRALFTESAEGLAQLMPAMLVTPHLAGALFVGAAPLFSLVLVDEAAGLLPEEAKMLMGLGNKTAFFGLTTGLAGEAGEPEIYRTLEAMGVQRFGLYQEHQQFPLHLLQRKGFPALQPDGPGQASFEAVDGLYDEQAETNSEEALHIISLLNRIEKTPQRTYPSVGIACFTKGQRDLISAYLLDIKQRRTTGVEMIQQLERNGLAVLQLEELAGLHFDILIISGTFGAVGLQGAMTGHLQRFLEDGGLAQITLLMSRADKQLFLANSIPEDILQRMAQAQDDKAARLLGAYFLAIRAASRSQWAEMYRMKEQLPEWASPPDPYPQPLVFFEEVEQHLRPYLEPGRLKWSRQDALAPLRVQAASEGQASFYLTAGGFLAQTPATDYRWEYEQQQELEKQGYLPLPAWPAEWWRSPEREAKRLASLIIRREMPKAAQEEEE